MSKKIEFKVSEEKQIELLLGCIKGLKQQVLELEIMLRRLQDE